jgi:peptidyl-prolyl isomerase G (cyclophilin G)
VEENIEERLHHRQKKSKHKKDRSTSLHSFHEGIEKRDEDQLVSPKEETEEQYDARLEREEKARLDLQRKRELERLKKIQEDTSPASGVRFKGNLIICLWQDFHLHRGRARKNEIYRP